MSNIVCINDWLDDDYIKYLHYKILYNYPHYYGEKSIISDPKHKQFYRSDLKKEDLEFLHFKLIKTFKKNIKVIEAYANIQHSDMSGSWHQDNGTTTYLLMVSDTLQKGEGCLEIKDKKINFIQNQLIAFPSELSHRGLASDSSLPRISIAFKTNE